MQLDENAIYRTRGGKEVGLVLLRLITSSSRFNILVEYQPANGQEVYENPQLELVDHRGYVLGEDEPLPRDLMQFIEYNEETYYQ